MRGRFHDHILHAGIRHVPKDLLQADRIGRRKLRLEKHIAVKYAQRADYASLFACKREDIAQNMTGSRLAVRATHGDQLEFFAGFP